jgi:hypothetical protein
VRGPNGRFVDRRDWKTGDRITLTADLRSAFAVVTARPGSGISAEQLRTNVERALSTARHVMVFSPIDAELQAAIRGETIPPDWLIPARPGDARPPREVVRDLGRRIAGRLQAQGVAAIAAGADAYTVTLALLAPGSSEPDVLTINLGDAASRARAFDALAQRLPPFVRPSIETSVVDVAGTAGAVVVRPGGVGAKAGLQPGDVIVAVGGKAVGSVADMQAAIAGLRASDAVLDIRSPNGTQRSVPGAIAPAADTIPRRDPSRLYNLALLEARASLDAAQTPVAKGAAHLNLALIHMRLLNWEDAISELKAAQLPDGPGVSSGTVAYLLGLCYEAVANLAEAQAAFTRAAASASARLWHEGPFIAPLARQKLQPGR